MRRGYRCHGKPLARISPGSGLRVPSFDFRVPGSEPEQNSEPVEALVVIPPADNQVDALAMEGLLASLTSTFSLEIIGDKAGRRFVVRARPPTLRYLRSQLESVYGQVTFQPLDEDPTCLIEGNELVTARLHLDHIPAAGLRTFRDGDFEHADPIRGVLGALADFAPDERAMVQLVLRPAPAGWDRPYRHLARPSYERLKAASPLGLGGSLALFGLLGVGGFLLLLALTSMATGRWPVGLPALVALAPVGYGWYRLVSQTQRTMAVDPQLIARKLGSPAFEFQLRLLAQAPTYAQARGRVLQLAAAFRQFDTGVGNGLTPVDADFDPLDLTTGWRRDRRGRPLDLLSAAEVASLWHLPVGGDVALVRRGRSRFIKPLPADVEKGESGVAIGVVAGDPDRTPVHLSPEAMRAHKLLVGKTQKGKSTLMQHLTLAHARAGEGVVYLDPHGDAVRGLLGLIPRERLDDVIYVDFGATERVVGWNPLAATEDAARSVIVESFIYAGEVVWDDFWGPRMESALRFSLLALTEANQKLAEEAPHRQLTIADIDAMLTLGQFKTLVLDRYVEDIEVHRWYRHYYAGLYDQKRQDVINPVQTKIHRFTGAPTVRLVFGQPQSTLDFDQMVRGQKVVLVNLDAGSLGPRNAALLGALFLTYLELAVRRQTSARREERARLAVVVDEFQQIPYHYQGLLAELQKMGAGFTMATQSLAQLDAVDRSLRGALLGNVDSLFVFQVSAMDAEVLVPELGGELETKDLTHLPAHQCYLRTIRGKGVVPTTRVETLRLPDPNPSVEEQVLARLPRYTRTVQEVEKILDDHRRYWYRREYEEYRKAMARARELLATEELARQMASQGQEGEGRGIVGSAEAGAGTMPDVLPYETVQKAHRRVKQNRVRSRKGKGVVGE